MRERDIEAALVRRVKELGGEVRKVQWVGRAHAPDRYVMLPGGEAFWVELKATGKVARPGQAREHQRMTKLGVPVFVADSIEAVQEILP